MKFHAAFVLRAIAFTAIVACAGAQQGVGQAAKARPQAPVTTDAQCLSTAPVKRVVGKAFYRDARGSVVDPSALAEHLAMIKPLRTFAERLIQDIDAGRFPCAQSNLEAWASSGALLERPASFIAVRERERFTFAINMAALRLHQNGQPLPVSVMDWLSSLNRQVADDFRRRGIVDNLYIWSGATAAVGAGVTGDTDLRRYATNVWRNGIDAIGPKGTIPSELRRGQRSLLYHAYYLSGLLIIEATRERPDASDLAALARLYDNVRTGTCQPKSFATSADLPEEDPPNRDDLATIMALMPNPDPPCGAGRALAYDPLRGGTPRESSAALRGLAPVPR